MKDFTKAGWKTAPLGELAQIRPNKKEAKSVLADDDEVSFVPMDCLKVDQVELAEHEARPLGKVYGGYTYFRDGDVLLAKITPCFENGKLGIANDLTNGVGFGSSEFFVLRPSEELLAGYLYHFLNRQSLRDWAKGQMTGAVGHKRVPKELVEALEIPLPPLEEQQRIVAVLDEAFEGLARARAHAEANLQNARELFENFLGALFTRNDANWISAPLQEIVESDCSLSYGIVQPGDDVSGGLAIVRPTDLGRRVITLDGLKRIDPAKADGYARTKLKGKEILLCVRGSTGVVAMASEELGGANVTRGIVPIRFDPEKMDQRLGYYQFLSKPVQDQIKAGTYGAALMQINIRDLRKLAFTIPPFSEQEVLLERLDSVANDSIH